MKNDSMRDKMANDVRALVEDAEALLNESVSSTGERTIELREKLKKRLCELREKVVNMETVVVQKTKEAAAAADDLVQEHPWKAVGVAAGVGLILGLLRGRR